MGLEHVLRKTLFRFNNQFGMEEAIIERELTSGKSNLRFITNKSHQTAISVLENACIDFWIVVEAGVCCKYFLPDNHPRRPPSIQCWVEFQTDDLSQIYRQELLIVQKMKQQRRKWLRIEWFIGCYLKSPLPSFMLPYSFAYQQIRQSKVGQWLFLNFNVYVSSNLRDC